MDNFLKSGRLGLDRGIDRVIYTKGQVSSNLPQHSEFEPTDIVGGSQVDELLNQPNLGNYLENWLRPQLRNRSLLLPTQFRKALDEAFETLSKAAEANPAQSKALKRAFRLIAEERNLRDLLQMYRSVLLLG